ncbi:hypothetical protein BDZ45DRAFT_62077 [Acephala macrosclerotiorum]|nr:hypothetical protein BDZ45DRAFT_62077 [Acephala macrosclerotiorum]
MTSLCPFKMIAEPRRNPLMIAPSPLSTYSTTRPYLQFFSPRSQVACSRNNCNHDRHQVFHRPALLPSQAHHHKRHLECHIRSFLGPHHVEASQVAQDMILSTADTISRSFYIANPTSDITSTTPVLSPFPYHRFIVYQYQPLHLSRPRLHIQLYSYLKS